MKTQSHPLFTILIGILLTTGCSALQIPGVVTVPPPGLTRIPAQPTQPVALPILPDTLTPFPVNTQSPVSTPAVTLIIPLTASSTVSPTIATSTALPTAPPTRSVQSGPSPTALPTDTAEPGGAAGPLPHYIIDVNMDYGKEKILDVLQEIDYPNTSGEKLTTIVLAVLPNTLPGIFDLKNIWADEAPLTNYSLEGQKLTLVLPFALENTKTIKLEFEYRLTLPDITQGDPNIIRPQIFGVTERQVNLTDWYPMVVPYMPGQGWVLHNPWFYGEHLVYPLADFDVNLRFKDPPGNDPVVAASGRGEPIKDGTHYELKIARDFVFSMGRQLKSTSDRLDGILVTSYYYPGSAAAGQAALYATIDALKSYTSLFGPYPHTSLAVVQGDFEDGMEFDGLYYLSDGFYNLYDNTNNNYLVMVAAHETSHQWWFGRVANDQALEPWLDEALATYCEKIFYETNHPESLSWWQYARIDFYQPGGKIDGNVSSYGGYLTYRNTVYLRGAQFMTELRQQIGDIAFFGFLKDYSHQMDGRIASGNDFFRILRLHSQADLADLFARYFTHPPKY